MYTVYSKLNCSHCASIIKLFDLKGIPYTKKTLGPDFNRKEFIEQFGKTTFPRIVDDNGNVIGGAGETVKFLKEEGIL